jgi:hypothetical protein
MITFLVVVCGGLVSAVITLPLGQPLQHYFWTRQQHGERQMAIIEEMNTLAADARGLLMHPEKTADRQLQLYSMLLKASVNVQGLFSEPLFQCFMSLDHAVRAAIRQAETTYHDARFLIDKHLLFSHSTSLIAMYHDMGIPAPPFGQWLQAQWWDPLLRGWCERWWPTLQQRVATDDQPSPLGDEGQ